MLIPTNAERPVPEPTPTVRLRALILDSFETKLLFSPSQFGM